MRRALVATLFLLIATVSPAHASCAEAFAAEQLPDSVPIVFSGTVVGSDDSSALIEVDRIFRGPNLERVVRVATKASDSGITSIDVDLVQGRTYLIGTDSGFRTNLCLTAPIGSVGAQVLELPTRDPVAGADQGFTESGTNPWVSAGIIVIVAGGFWWLLRIRRRAHRQFE